MKRSLGVFIAGLLFLVTLPEEGAADRGANHKVRQPRPIQLGTSGGNVNDHSQRFCCSGTLGALVNAGGVLQILSNNHVLARNNDGSSGDDINQPGSIDVGCQIVPSDFVAALSQFQPISFSSSNTIDAAIATIRSGQVRTDGAILDIGQPSSIPGGASIGMAVKKSGRTSGLTHGRIVSIAVTVNVGYPTECGGDQVRIAQFVNQIRIRGKPFFRVFSKGGDSGSLVVEDTASCPRPVGLLFAGGRLDTFANPINDVLSAFGATIVGCSPSATQELDEPEGGQVSEGEVAAALAVQQRYIHALMQIPGVVGMGVGQSEETGRVVIEVYLEEATPRLGRAIPTVLEGIAVERVVTGKIFALSCPASSASRGATLVGGLDVQEPEVAAAIAVQRRHTDALMQIPGVVGMGVGQSEETGRVVIEVYLEKMTARLQQAIPHDLEGIPVRKVVTGKVSAR